MKNNIIYFIISHSVILRMRNDSYKFEEKIRNFYAQYLPEIRVVYEIMWKNTVLSGRPQMVHEQCKLDT
jgi:hypothetical protein